uniref:Uncharacterized protein n=1 Tax=Romanomermis culicivorax TaxID=13658 RepID=A0A915JJD9_ROMCU
HCSTSVGKAVRRNSTFTIGDGPAHGSRCLTYGSRCPTYGSAIGTAFEKFDTVIDAVDGCPNHRRSPTLPALPKIRSAQGYGLPKSKFDIAW